MWEMGIFAFGIPCLLIVATYFYIKFFKKKSQRERALQSKVSLIVSKIIAQKKCGYFFYFQHRVKTSELEVHVDTEATSDFETMLISELEKEGLQYRVSVKKLSGTPKGISDTPGLRTAGWSKDGSILIWTTDSGDQHVARGCKHPADAI